MRKKSIICDIFRWCPKLSPLIGMTLHFIFCTLDYKLTLTLIFHLNFDPKKALKWDTKFTVYSDDFVTKGVMTSVDKVLTKISYLRCHFRMTYCRSLLLCIFSMLCVDSGQYMHHLRKGLCMFQLIQPQNNQICKYLIRCFATLSKSIPFVLIHRFIIRKSTIYHGLYENWSLSSSSVKPLNCFRSVLKLSWNSV